MLPNIIAACHNSAASTPQFTMSWFITNFIAAFLLPPLSLLLALALGIVLLLRRSKFARPLLLAVFGLLWLSATPYFADGALHLLEARTAALNNRQGNGHSEVAVPDKEARYARSPHLNPLGETTSHSTKLPKTAAKSLVIPQAGEGANESPRESRIIEADAIVILGGGTYFHAPEYAGQDTVGNGTLLRLRYAAKLWRETGKPLLATGGKPLGNSTSEAQQMRASLEQDFRVPVRWVEDASDNTFENARYSFLMLQKAGIKKIYLVTHAWHMPRAAAVFRHAGFEVIEAPTAFTTRHRLGILEFMPDSESLHKSRIFVHEVIGLLWYRVRSIISDT